MKKNKNFLIQKPSQKLGLGLKKLNFSDNEIKELFNEALDEALDCYFDTIIVDDFVQN